MREARTTRAREGVGEAEVTLPSQRECKRASARRIGASRICEACCVVVFNVQVNDERASSERERARKLEGEQFVGAPILNSLASNCALCTAAAYSSPV